MDPTLYFSVFVGFIAVCLAATVLWRPPTRTCFACDAQTKLDAKRCPHCGYTFRQAT
jgi:predicted amidophosphoribosyltransferase